MDIIEVVVNNDVEYNVVDFDDLPYETQVIEVDKVINGERYDVVIVDGEMFIVNVEDPGPTIEDLVEWQKAGCGMDYWDGRT